MAPTAVLPRLLKLLLLLAAVAPTAANHTCVPRPDGTCGAAVCERCCKDYLGDQHACDACVATECASPEPEPKTCE
eukprot:COSAG01_NODE_657_length_14457_cov_99.379649_18_plen_76_part_00